MTSSSALIGQIVGRDRISLRPALLRRRTQAFGPLCGVELALVLGRGALSKLELPRAPLGTTKPKSCTFIVQQGAIISASKIMIHEKARLTGTPKKPRSVLQAFGRVVPLWESKTLRGTGPARLKDMIALGLRSEEESIAM